MGTYASCEASYLEPDEPGPCQICHKSSERCECPECPRCGRVGDPDCYKYHDLERRIEENEAFDLIRQSIDVGAKAVHELAEIRATLLANFGPGRKQSHIVEITDDKSISTFKLMFHILEKLWQKVEAIG